MFKLIKQIKSCTENWQKFKVIQSSVLADTMLKLKAEFNLIKNLRQLKEPINFKNKAII